MAINISIEIEKLIKYGILKRLIEKEDIIYVKNNIMNILSLKEIEDVEISIDKIDTPTETLNNILDWAFENKIIDNNSVESRDLLDTRIMGIMIKRPSEIIREFNYLYNKNKRKATDYYYNISKASNYIRVDRVRKDIKWKTETEFGKLDITINLSKPEKDPKDIAAKRNTVSSNYPKCLLCVENEGYAGRIGYPARENHRIIPLELNSENWFLQYSPYVYYNEHCIVLKGKHEGMKITESTFKRLLDFIEQFPHYFIGTNADLPIVGGSILSHDHFQGGNYEFAMAKAPIEKEYNIGGFNNVKIGKVKWPMSTIRLESHDKYEIFKVAYKIYSEWKKYSDESVQINAFTEDIEHNTVTPIARQKNGKLQIDLILRNNRTTKESPFGIFHPHEELHHIKKENIGLIEAMGLAVLPSRLKNELKEVENYILGNKKIDEIDKDINVKKHKEWIVSICKKYENINEDNVENIIKEEVGLKFLEVLKDSGVFKRNEKGQQAFDRFILSLGGNNEN